MKASRLLAFILVAGALLAGAIAHAQQKAESPKPATVAAQKATDPSPILIRDARNAGFRPEHIRGTLMFCRTTKELGSNFPVRTCYDEEQVKVKIEEYQAERNQLNQLHSNGVTGN